LRLVKDVPYRGMVQPLFAVEVIIHCRGVRFGAFADLPNGGSLESFLSEDFASGLQESISRVFEFLTHPSRL
jgi:hypothetical protein